MYVEIQENIYLDLKFVKKIELKETSHGYLKWHFAFYVSSEINKKYKPYILSDGFKTKEEAEQWFELKVKPVLSSYKHLTINPNYVILLNT